MSWYQNGKHQNIDSAVMLSTSLMLARLRNNMTITQELFRTRKTLNPD